MLPQKTQSKYGFKTLYNNVVKIFFFLNRTLFLMNIINFIIYYISFRQFIFTSCGEHSRTSSDGSTDNMHSLFSAAFSRAGP